MISREILEQLKVPALKEVCRGYNLAISGKKTELFERIIAHQEKLEKQKADKLQRLAYGAEEGDCEFEAAIAKFFDWCKKNNYTVNEMAENGCSYRPVDHEEIRASLKEYDPAASTLRNDRLVPVPRTQIEIFLEMFFDKLGGEWEMFSSAGSDGHDVDFECVEHQFSAHMKANNFVWDFLYNCSPSAKSAENN